MVRYTSAVLGSFVSLLGLASRSALSLSLPSTVPFEILIAFCSSDERAERPFAHRIDIAVCRLKLGNRVSNNLA